MASAASAEKKLREAVGRMSRSENQAVRDRRKWEAACLDAFDAGLTYQHIAAISGKSKVRIDQVIRQQRIDRGIPVNSK